MQNDQAPKKHHFVPECYLRPFTVDRQLYTLDIHKVRLGHQHKPKRNNPSQICYQENYYTIDTEDSISSFSVSSFDKLFIESEALKSLEDKYKALYNALTVNYTVTLQQAIDMADFIIQMKLRNPHWKDNTIETKKEEWVKDSIKNIREQVKADRRFRKIPHNIQDRLIDNLMEKNLEDPQLATNMQQFGLVERYLNRSGNNSKVREAIVNCQWSIYIAPANGPYFITSDNPGVAIDKNSKVYNSKFNDGFFYMLPLSPRYCLVINDLEKDDTFKNNTANKYLKRGEISGDQVNIINNLSLQYFNQILIAGDTTYLVQIATLNFKKGVE